MDCHKGALLLSAGVANPLKATIEEFAHAYEAASADEQAALRAWMRNIILPAKTRRSDMGRVRRSEKESIEARDRRILKFLSR